MNIQDCIKFANENPVCYLATAEGDQPRVRALGFWFADETGFYFQTANMKDMLHQLEKNPKVEAAFYNHEGMIGTMMRIAGEVEFINDEALNKKVIEDRPFLKPYEKEIVVFRIPHGVAYFWTMETNLDPKKYIGF